MNTWKRPKLTKKEKEIQQSQRPEHAKTRNRIEETNNMENPRRKNHQANRLPGDKPQIRKLRKDGPDFPRMESKHGTTTTWCAKNAHMSKTNEKLQEKDTTRNMTPNKIRHKSHAKRPTKANTIYATP